MLHHHMPLMDPPFMFLHNMVLNKYALLFFITSEIIVILILYGHLPDGVNQDKIMACFGPVCL